MTSRPFFRAISFGWTLFAACQGESPEGHLPDDTISDGNRSPGQSTVSWLKADANERIWLEEGLAPWPEHTGDRDPGMRRIVLASANTPPIVIWASSGTDRLTAAVAHPRADSQTVWSGVGVDGERRPFLLRGDLHGEIARMTIEDPDLAADRAAWLGDTAPTALRIGVLSEDSVRIAASAEDSDEVAISLMSEQQAVLLYRYRWDGTKWQRVARQLISPAMNVTPFLPIGATYDNFDAIVNPFATHLTVTKDGAAYVAFLATSSRMKTHNAHFGTDFQPLRSEGSFEKASDILLIRSERSGTFGWSRLVGTPDVDDEVYAVAAGPSGQVAIAGRARRELGLDNTEWHATIFTLDTTGLAMAEVLFDTRESGIAQSAAFAADGSLYVGGSEGWTQNPAGFSLQQNGSPLLLHLSAVETAGHFTVTRKDELLPMTSGHSELRALSVNAKQLWLGGLERGPLTHTGDGDRSLIRADGWRSSVEIQEESKLRKVDEVRRVTESEQRANSARTER